jgi:uncharacterized protein (TIGR02266 family)
MKTLPPYSNPGPDSPDASFDLTIDVSFDSESHFFVDLSCDLTQGGIFVTTYRDIAVGTNVAIACRLLDDEIELYGVVAWQRDAGDGCSPGIGVTLGVCPPATRAAIERFCTYREPLFYEVDAMAA